MMSKLETVLQMLWERSRFTSFFYQSVQLKAENNIPTLALHATEHRLSLLLHPDFVSEINPEELIGLLVHEMMHVILNHDHRGLDHHDPILQNLAQDMVVNTYLTDNRETFFSKRQQGKRDFPRLTLPSGLPRIPEAFFLECPARKKEDITWEILYQWLAGKKKETPSEITEQAEGEDFRLNHITLAGNDLIGLLEEKPDGLSFHDRESKYLPTGIHLFQNRDNLTTVEALKNRVISYSRQDENCQDERFFQHVSGMIRKIQPVDKPFHPKMLKAFVESASLSETWDYSTSRFDRRYFASGLYTPGRVYRKKKTITVAVDVSGSMVMRPEGLEEAFGVVESLLHQYMVFLLCIDETVFVPFKNADKLQKSQQAAMSYQYQKGDWRYIQTGNSGTTFFSPLFDRFMKGHREPLIIITDGDIYDLDQLKKYPPTLWVITGKRGKPFQPPFGKAVRLLQ